MKKIISAIILMFLSFTSSAMAADMKVSFEWGQTKKCSDRNSPPFKLSGVPKGTKILSFSMVDRNAPSYNHGGGKIAYNGQSSLPYGAFKYNGPCPPQGSHTYSWTIKAIDAKGKTLATEKVVKKFP